MALWNELNLKMPPMASYSISKEKGKKFTYLKNTLSGMLSYLNEQKEFHEANTINSKLIYIKNSQFRSNPGLHNLKKVKTAYLRFKSMKIDNIIQSFIETMSLDEYSNNWHLPTKQCFEYFLVRLQGLVKIFVRIVICSRIATENFLNLLNMGFFVELNTLLLGVLAQIWFSARKICQKIVQLFNAIIPFHTKLKGKLQWLPENYEFPEDLGAWIGDDWNTEIINRANKFENQEMKIDYSALNRILKNEDEDIGNPSNIINNILDSNVEVGEEIKRTDFKSAFKKQKSDFDKKNFIKF